MDALFEMAASLTRTLPALYEVREYLRGRSHTPASEMLKTADQITGLVYSFRRQPTALIDDVVPATAGRSRSVDMAEIARRAIHGEAAAKADVDGAWETFRVLCVEMGLPATAANAAEAYLARQLQRLAEREAMEGPATRLVRDPALLAAKARDYGIDRGDQGDAKRWKMRLERHPA